MMSIGRYQLGDTFLKRINSLNLVMRYYFIILFFLSILFSVEYQDVIYLKDGSIVKGTIIETKPNKYIKIKSDDNIFVYNMEEIDVIKKEEIEGYAYKDPNSSRYFFAPTAIPIGKDNSYIRTTWLFFPSYGSALSKNISTEIGISVLPGASLEDQLKQFSYKYSLEKKDNKWRSSFGFLYLGGFEGGGGFIFGSFTTGNEDKNFSVTPGLAYMRNKEEVKFAENLTLVLSAKNRVSKSLSLISENWFFFSSDDTMIISNSGFRFFGKQLSVDFSWPFFFSVEGSGIGLPLFTFSYKF
tara:strand:- start:164 stop:1057 length:894 start_codon:yes stop_codon:yes gene_type:complete